MKYTAQVTSELDAWHCGEQVSDWLTAHFSPYTPDKRYYLVYAPANHYGETLLYNGRALQQYLKWQESENKRALFEGRKEKALFQDLTRFSLATMPSLHQHRTVTGRKTDSMLRFRPNFVVDGKFNPFDEDKWYKIKIGNVIFERVKGISRCVMVNIDESGNVDRGSNTCLNSLMRYRKVTAVLDDLESQHNMNSAIFGAHLVYSGVEINGVEHNVWIPDLKVTRGETVYVKYRGESSSTK